RAQLERASMQAHEVLHDRQSKSGAPLGGPVCQRALSERLHDARYLLLGNAGPGVLDAQHLPAVGRRCEDDVDAPAARGEFERVGEQVEANLAQGALVAPDQLQSLGELQDDVETLALRTQLEQAQAVLDEVAEAHRLLVKLVASRLDAGEIEDLVDELEQVTTTVVDAPGIVAVVGVLDGPE